MVLRDVANAGVVVRNRISRDVSLQLDLEEALEAWRYTCHPYSAHPRELVLLKVCYSARGDGTDPYAEVSLQRLLEYTAPSDGVTMTCMTCTDKGRIFLAGRDRDGHIYELLYSTLLGGRNVVVKWVVPNVFKFGALGPIVEMVIDNERCIAFYMHELKK